MAEEKRNDKNTDPSPNGGRRQVQAGADGGGGGQSGPGEASRRSGRNRRFKGPKRDAQQQDTGTSPDKNSPAGIPEVRRDSPNCPLCGKAIYDLSNAVSERESGLPSHFDCILDRVTAAETLAQGEKVVYLGSGSFGVVEFKDKSDTIFTIKRRIQWEKEGEKKDWRKSMSTGIINL